MGTRASMVGRVWWVVRVGGDDWELRPWHYIYVYSIESRLITRVRYGSHIPVSGFGFKVSGFGFRVQGLDWL